MVEIHLVPCLYIIELKENFNRVYCRGSAIYPGAVLGQKVSIFPGCHISGFIYDSCWVDATKRYLFKVSFGSPPQDPSRILDEKCEPFPITPEGLKEMEQGWRFISKRILENYYRGYR